MIKFIIKLICLLLISSTVVFSQNQIRKETVTDSIKKVKINSEISGYPVVPFKDTLFLIYNKIGSFTAKERAKAISDRIKSLYE